MSKQRNSSEPPAPAQHAPKPEPWLERALDPAVMSEILKLAGINPAAKQRSGPSVADHRPGTSSSDAIPPRNGDTVPRMVRDSNGDWCNPKPAPRRMHAVTRIETGGYVFGGIGPHLDKATEQAGIKRNFEPRHASAR